MKTITVTDEQYEMLKNFKSLLLSQDTRSTSNPIYCAEKEITIYGVCEDYAFNYVWIIDGEVEFSTNEELFNYLIENGYEEELKEVYCNNEDTEYDLKSLKINFLSDIEYCDTGIIYEEFLDTINAKKIYFREENIIEHNNGLFSLFEQDIKNYITKDTEKYHSYAVSSYRCNNMNNLRKLLIDLNLE